MEICPSVPLIREKEKGGGRSGFLPLQLRQDRRQFSPHPIYLTTRTGCAYGHAGATISGQGSRP